MLNLFEYVYDPVKRKVDPTLAIPEYTEDDNPIEIIQTYKYRESDEYYMFPRGDLRKLKNLFGHLKWVDDRAIAPIKYKLKFNGKLYDDQKRVVHDWISAGTGIMKADTGWGKNFVLGWLIAKLRQCTLVFGDNKSLVSQLHEEFREHTNIKELEEEHELQLAGTIHQSKVNKFFPIVTFTTYQTFIERWEANLTLLRKHRRDFGLVWLNECHIVPAPGIAKCFQFLPAMYRGGDTATPEKKDGREVVTYDLVGPVTAEGQQESMPFDATIIHTGLKYHPRMRAWHKILEKSTGDTRQNEIIRDKVAEDAEAGHCVLVLTDRRQHAEDLQSDLQMMGYDFGLHYGKSEKRNDGVRQAAKDGELHGIIAVSKTTEKGFNVPRLSRLHITCPMNNAPNLKQRTGRIRRVWRICKKCDEGHAKRVDKCTSCGHTKFKRKRRRVYYYLGMNNTIVERCGWGTVDAFAKQGAEHIDHDHSYAPETHVKEGKNSMGLSKFGQGDD